MAYGLTLIQSEFHGRYSKWPVELKADGEPRASVAVCLMLENASLVKEEHIILLKQRMNQPLFIFGKMNSSDPHYS